MAITQAKWESAGLDLKLSPYLVVATGDEIGYIEARAPSCAHPAPVPCPSRAHPACAARVRSPRAQPACHASSLTPSAA
jgi:hypothetical protein